MKKILLASMIILFSAVSVERNHDNQWSYDQDKSGIKG